MRKRTSFLLILIAIIVVLGAGAYLGIKYWPSSRVVDTSDFGLARANGSAQLVWFDDNDRSSHFNVDVAAIPFGSTFAMPTVINQGAAWQRQVWTYDDPKDVGCERNILYFARPEKQMKQSSIPYCVFQTLDQHDITHYLAKSDDQKTIAFGAYDGGVIATHALIDDTENYPLTATASNWEMTKFVLVFGHADPNSTAWKLIQWTPSSNDWKDVTPVGWTGGDVVYDHDTDTFNIVTTKQVEVTAPTIQNIEIKTPIK